MKYINSSTVKSKRRHFMQYTLRPLKIVEHAIKIEYVIKLVQFWNFYQILFIKSNSSTLST